MEYDRQFYLNTHKLNQQAANVVLPIIFDITPVRSAVDVGCGVGTWLYSAEKLGVETILGIDGPSLDKNLAIVDEKFIETHDLEYEIKIGSKFDLAISLEVAEHLSDERADGFVGDLCALSDLVLFSAAIPGQGGTHHCQREMAKLLGTTVRTTKLSCLRYRAMEDLVSRRRRDVVSTEYHRLLPCRESGGQGHAIGRSPGDGCSPTRRRAPGNVCSP